MSHRPYEVKRPLSNNELDRVFAAADSINEWTGHLVRFFAWTGTHPVVLYAPEPYGAHVEGDLFVLTRAKNERDVQIPIKLEMRPWLAPWLQEPRPASPRAYHRILARVGKIAGLRLTFLRLRHTACLLFLREYGLPATDVQRLLGVTAETLRIYAERPMEDIAKDLAGRGW